MKTIKQRIEDAKDFFLTKSGFDPEKNWYLALGPDELKEFADHCKDTRQYQSTWLMSISINPLIEYDDMFVVRIPHPGVIIFQ